VRKRKVGTKKTQVEVFERDDQRRTGYVTAWKEARYCLCGRHIKAGGWGTHKKGCVFARSMDDT
jgi:hypothetical protein